jgi:lauroyl/myristoyl acyltransferase
MKLTLMRLFHRTPGLRRVTERIHPVWFFRLTHCSVTIAHLFWPHTKKLAQPFRAVVGDDLDPRELRVRARRYLLFLRLFKELELTWSNWEARHKDWITVDGEPYLAKALQSGKGAILISCHNFGFSKLVAPALTLRGYKIHRGGGGKKDGRRVTRWGKDYQIGWQYLDYRDDYWHRLQSLKAMQTALAANAVIHVSPHAYRQGEAEIAVEFFGHKYYLDSRWFRVFQMCRAPVLPCFALATTDGQIEIKIHPALPTGEQPMAKRFAEMVSEYLTRFPEMGRVWKDVYLSRDKF